MSESSGAPVSANGAKLFQAAFDLGREGPDWPPVAVERLWGEKTAVKFELRIINIPFFARGIAVGDLVQVRPDHDRRELVFEKFKKQSGHSTVRLILMQSDRRAEVETLISGANCQWESAHSLENFLSMDVPPEVVYQDLRREMFAMKESGIIGIEESAISDLHREQSSGPGL